MKIYIAHSTSYNYHSELYEPLQRMFESAHDLILPHINNSEQFDSKKLFKTKGCEVIIADVSLPSIGLGIELGWANIFGIPIICIHKDESAPPASLNMVTNKFIEYKDISDIQVELNSMLDEL